MTSVAYKILSSNDWRRMVAEGRYQGSAVDLADGYIHMSTAETARRHYAGQADLMLLTIDLALLDEALVWEPSRGGALFPHLYAPLPVAAVTASRPFAVAEDGAMRFEDAA